jgi:hypothetical protein
MTPLCAVTVPKGGLRIGCIQSELLLGRLYHQYIDVAIGGQRKEPKQ